MLNIFQEFPRFERYFCELQHIKKDFHVIHFAQEQELLSLFFLTSSGGQRLSMTVLLIISVIFYTDVTERRQYKAW